MRTALASSLQVSISIRPSTRLNSLLALVEHRLTLGELRLDQRGLGSAKLRLEHAQPQALDKVSSGDDLLGERVADDPGQGAGEQGRVLAAAAILADEVERVGVDVAQGVVEVGVGDVGSGAGLDDSAPGVQIALAGQVELLERGLAGCGQASVTPSSSSLRRSAGVQCAQLDGW